MHFLFTNYLFLFELGSTIVALHYLEEHGLRSAIIGAVEVSTKRCKEVSSIQSNTKKN